MAAADLRAAELGAVGRDRGLDDLPLFVTTSTLTPSNGSTYPKAVSSTGVGAFEPEYDSDWLVLGVELGSRLVTG